MYKIEEDKLQDHPDAQDVISLRYLVLAISRRWYIIACLMITVAVTVFASHRYLGGSVYESSAVVRFRDESMALNIDSVAFEALASSPKVMEEILRKTNGDYTVNELRRIFSFSLRGDSPFLTVSARTHDPHEAVELVNAWVSVVRDETYRYMEAYLAERSRIANAHYLAQREIVAGMELALAKFDMEHPLAILESDLEREIKELNSKEQQLQALYLRLRANEASADILREALAQESTTLGAEGLLMQTTAGGELHFYTVDPTSVDIRRRLIGLESELAADRQTIASLESRLPELRERVHLKIAQMVDTKLQRDRLLRDLEEKKKLFESAQSERDQILQLELQLPSFPRISVVSDPLVPDRPVSDRLVFNLVVGVILAGLIGAMAALISEWWRADRGQTAAHAVR